MPRTRQGDDRNDDKRDESARQTRSATDRWSTRWLADPPYYITHNPVAVRNLQAVGELTERTLEVDHRCPISVRSLARARAVLDFTVPTATPTATAVSTSDNPAKYL